MKFSLRPSNPEDPIDLSEVESPDPFDRNQQIKAVVISCDTFDAITKSLESLDAFTQLIHTRHQAGYDQNIRLDEWVVLGRFILDTCGNFMKINGDSSYYIIPAERTPGFPKVATREYLLSYIEGLKQKPDDYFSVSSSPSWLPGVYQICPVCKKGWTTASCHDFADHHDDKVIDAKNFVGQTVAEFKAKWNRDNHEVDWFLRPEANLRNKRYIDHSIRQDSDWHREHKIQVNERGWVETSDDHIIEPGDFLYVHLVTYRHEKCYRTRQARLQHDYFERIFQSAGFQEVVMTQIPNQYHGEDCHVCAPWYQVVADGLNFTIGRRKHVISIEIKDRRLNLEALFRHEDVTKEKELIHADNREKCVDYLAKIRITAFSHFWFLHQVTFWPRLILRFFKNRFDWTEILFTNPKLYWKLRFQKNKI